MPDKLICCPKDYVGLTDMSDDYDVTAKLQNVKPALKAKVDAFISKNPNRRYYDRSGYNKYGPPGNGQG